MNDVKILNQFKINDSLQSIILDYTNPSRTLKYVEQLKTLLKLNYFTYNGLFRFKRKEYDKIELTAKPSRLRQVLLSDSIIFCYDCARAVINKQFVYKCNNCQNRMCMDCTCLHVSQTMCRECYLNKYDKCCIL